MKDWIIGIVVLLIIMSISGLLIKDAKNKRYELHGEIIETVETSKTEIINEVKRNSEKLDKIINIITPKTAFENDK